VALRRVDVHHLALRERIREIETCRHAFGQSTLLA
jgi:hypothetical protein